MPERGKLRGGGLESNDTFAIARETVTLPPVTHKASNLDEMERRIIVRVGKRVTRLLSFYYHNLTVLSPCPIPPRGGAIIVCNHTSSLDPLYIQAACPRLITWMMAREYGYTFGTRWFFNAIEPIMVDRGGRDMAATRAALRALKDGKLLAMFPEGRIEKDRELLEFQPGAALLALKSGAPVYPAFLDGTQRRKGMLEASLMPNRSTLCFGPAVEFDRANDARDGIEHASWRIKEAVESLGKSCG
jgi:1-acyl-sn-glycerol-3-phosphate acyltransferase